MKKSQVHNIIYNTESDCISIITT